MAYPLSMDTLISSLADSLPLLKVLVSFAGMLVLIRLKLGVGTSILLGSLLLGLLFGMSPVAWGETALNALVLEKCLALMAIIALILILSEVMERTGQSRKLMDALAGLLHRPRLRLVFFPALIGLLPMPGGAVFSAPMIKTAAGDLPLTRRRMTLLNYWFRHVWEMAWPLYPGVILAASLSGVPISVIIVMFLPGVALALWLGWLFFLRPSVLPLPKAEPLATGQGGSAREIFFLGLPLLTAIGGAVLLEMLMAWVWPDLPFEAGMCLALGLGALIAYRQSGAGWTMLFNTMKSKGFYQMVLVVAGVFIYQQTLAQAGAVKAIAAMAGGTLALYASAVLLPFLVGMVSGIAIAYVGATFPLMLGMLDQMGLQGQLLPFLVLGVFSGYTGVMVSPLHICLVLSCQYFNEPLSRVWRRLVLPGAILLAAGVGYFLILRTLST